MSDFQHNENKALSRKEFLATCGTGCLILTGLMALSQSCSTLTYVPYTMADKKLAVKKSDLEKKPFVLIRVEQLQAPIYLSKTSNGYVALLMVCTHKQCEVAPYGKVLHCPCHGSEFDNNGQVLQGPAEKPLTRFTVSEDETSLYIQ